MRILILLLITASLIIGCRNPSNNIEPVHQDTTPYEQKPSAEIGHDIEIKVDEEKDTEKASCTFKDGTHAATVNYHNPTTDHTATYNDLQVHVKDCKIVQIDFPNGGWLDESHIPATRINDNGEATLKDDKGRTWKIHLH